LKLIAGLGNPGARYRGTRHNLGFVVLDDLAAALGAAFGQEKHKGLLAQAAIDTEKVLLLKPKTYMNRSGDCVAAVARNKAPDPGDILVVVDDVNLALGKIRLRAGGSAGGHNGLKSIAERLGTTAFHRLRLGVGAGPGQHDLADHVLARFRPDEREAVADMTARAVEAAQVWVREGIETAMNRFN